MSFQIENIKAFYLFYQDTVTSRTLIRQSDPVFILARHIHALLSSARMTLFLAF